MRFKGVQYGRKKEIGKERSKCVSGGDPAEIEKIDDEDKRPGEIPDSKPLEPLIDPNKGKSIVCPKCGNFGIFEVVSRTSESMRIKCMACGTEFEH